MNNVQKQINEMFDDLEESKLYKSYLMLKKQLETDEEIVDLIKEIKRYQKILANNNDISVEKKLKELNDKLNSYPVYQSYLIVKEELEQTLFQIKDIFEKYFSELLKI